MAAPQPARGPRHLKVGDVSRGEDQLTMHTSSNNANNFDSEPADMLRNQKMDYNKAKG